MKCPQCGNTEDLRIGALASCVLTIDQGGRILDEGEFSNPEWGPESAAWCGSLDCEWTGTVRDLG